MEKLNFRAYNKQQVAKALFYGTEQIHASALDVLANGGKVIMSATNTRLIN